MLATFIPVLAIIGLSVLGLSIGVILGRRPIRGSCGGLSCHTCRAGKEIGK